MENSDWYLAVKKRNQGLGLKAIDLLILSQIEEFQNNGYDCYMTNEQFSYMFGESISTVKRSIDRLEELNILKRNTISCRDDGKGKKRTLAINDRGKWKIPTKVHIEPWSEDSDATKVHIEPWSCNDSENTKVHIEPWSDTTKVHIEPWSEYQGSNVDVPRFKSDPTKVHIEPIKDKEKKNKKINNGHCVPFKTAPSASSVSHPSGASVEKKKTASEKDKNSVVGRISYYCECPPEEIEGIVNDNGLDYDALLHCVENGYINGRNLYSKTHWDSMDIDDILRDPTYGEYLVGMYRSNPDGLTGSKPNSDDGNDIVLDATTSIIMTNDDVSDGDDMSWLADVSDWLVE